MMFIDKYNEIWEKIKNEQVKRLSDGMIGNYFEGNGLKKIDGRKYKKRYKILSTLSSPNRI